eukprot:1161312-Pelagomonas_calceolata.AAC.1
MRRAYCKRKLSAGCVLDRNGEIQLLKKGGADWSRVCTVTPLILFNPEGAENPFLRASANCIPAASLLSKCLANMDAHTNMPKSWTITETK